MYKLLNAVGRMLLALAALVVLSGWSAWDLVEGYQTGIAKYPRGRPVAAGDNYFLFVSILASKVLVIALGLAAAWYCCAPIFADEKDRNGRPPQS